jgi:hypothetical protein
MRILHFAFLFPAAPANVALRRTDEGFRVS